MKSNTRHLEVENNAAKTNEQSKSVEDIVKIKLCSRCNQCIDLNASSTDCNVYNPENTLKKRTNPPFRTPTLSIHQLVQCIHGVTLWSSVVVFLVTHFCPTFPSMLFNIHQSLNIVAMLRLYWGFCQVEKLVSLHPLGSISHCVVAQPQCKNGRATT